MESFAVGLGLRTAHVSLTRWRAQEEKSSEDGAAAAHYQGIDANNA